MRQVTVLSAATTRLLAARVAREQSQRRLPSLVAGVFRSGELAWTGGAGLVHGAVPDADVQYRCGSITKTFAAVLVMALRDDGELDLEDPLERHLPGTPVGSATIGALLAHASGLRAETAGPWWERTAGGTYAELVASSLGADARLTRPGRRFHYSNVGYALLGEVVARLRGAPWDQVLRAELLEPLGLTRTTTRPQDPAAPALAVHPFADVVLPEPEHDAGAMAPAGQLWSTVTDLARWGAFLSGTVAGPVAPATLAEMREPQALVDIPGQPWTAAHGLGVQVWNADGRRSFGHGGSMPGFLAALQVGLDAEGRPGDGVVVCTNTTAGLGYDLASDLLDLLAEHEPVAAPVWLPAPVPGDILELAGPWFWGPAPMLVRAEAGGGLLLAPLEPPGRTSRFRPAPAGTWVGLDGYFAGETLRVVRRPDGTPAHLDVASFVLTRSPYDPVADVPGGVAAGGWSGGDPAT